MNHYPTTTLTTVPQAVDIAPRTSDVGLCVRFLMV
jgi:hypothetical protein